MSEKLGPRVFGSDHGQPFVGREFSSEPDYSDDVAREIDAEIRRVVEDAHGQATRILEAHRAELERISELLVRRETIERREFLELLEGRDEAEVFGPDEPVVPEPGPEPERPERPEPRTRPLPRPGLATD